MNDTDDSDLFKDRSFWGIVITQFLGAFNDNLYKQLMLLMAIPGVGALIQGDRQGWATTVFSLPFVLLSNTAGYLADRYSKSQIITLCKIAEIAITLLAVTAFWFYGNTGDYGTWTVLVLMGTHSTFFGPSKYGILPELFRDKYLPLANALILMTTFLAIIFGVVFAGIIKDLLVMTNADGSQDFSNLWIGALACTVIAAVGTVTSTFIRRTPPAQPKAVFQNIDLFVSEPIRALLKRDKPLLLAIIASSLFWLVGGLVMPVVNRLGRSQLELTSDTKTSILTGGLAIGIMVGASATILFFKRLRPDRQVSLGVAIMLLAMGLLSIWKPGGDLLLSYNGALTALIAMGIGAAVFVIPLQVFLQQRPPAELKGRLIATMNIANFIGILLAGPIYQLFIAIADSMHWPVSSVFAMMAALLLPILLFYRFPVQDKTTT